MVLPQPQVTAEVQHQQAVHDWLMATAGVTEQQYQPNPLTQQLNTLQEEIFCFAKTTTGICENFLSDHISLALTVYL